MFFLKQNTAAIIQFGPALDIEGLPVVGLTKGGVDEVGVYKNGATTLTDLSAVDITHRAGGMYTTQLASGSVGTLGTLRFYIRDDSECIPVWEDFTVLPANVYDSLVAGSDNLEVDVTLMATNVLDADSLKADAVTKIVAGILAGIIDVVSLKTAIKEIKAAVKNKGTWNRSTGAYAERDDADGVDVNAGIISDDGTIVTRTPD